MDWITAANNWLNAIVWGPPFLVLLIGTGLYLTIRLGFLQFTKLGFTWKQSFGRLFSKEKEDEGGAITSFQAVSSAMAATIGVGNIAGVATAMALGGPGAIFWMWLSGLVGMATKFGEATLGVKYRTIDEDGNVQGGVMYYIEKGMGSNWKWLAVLYAFLTGIAALGIGNMVQANTMAASLEKAVNLPPMVTGVLAILLVGAVILGGIKRIGLTAEKIVPFMAITYVLGAIFILITHADKIPAAFGDIFYYAFNPHSAVGGFAGATVAYAIRFGIARGVFSNEAGLGGASIVHAQAKNTPTRQGFWGIWEVFIDTIVVCTATALVIMVTGSLWVMGPEGVGTLTGGVLAAEAFSAGMPGIGGTVVLVGLALFSFTTMLTWSFYGEKSWEYVFGKKIVLPYRVLFLVFLFVGATGGLKLIWSIADTLNGLMAAPNLIALLVLSAVLVKEKNSYMSGLKGGK